jgi:hypothetical protein
MPFGPTDVFWIGVVPCLAAALAMLVAGRLRTTAAWSLSVASGLIVGMVAQNVRVGWQSALQKLLHPHAAVDWLPWLVLVAAGIGMLAVYAPRRWQRWLVALACVFALAVPFRLLASNAAAMSRWTVTEKLAILAFWSVTIAAMWLTLALGRLNRQPLIRGSLLVVVALGISVTLAASGAITLGELGGIAAATVLGVAGSARLSSPKSASVPGRISDGPSHAAGPLAVMFGSLILLGCTYDLSATNAALLAFSLAAAGGWLPVGWPDNTVGRAALRAALTLVPLAIAAASAISTALADTYG